MLFVVVVDSSDDHGPNCSPLPNVNLRPPSPPSFTALTETCIIGHRIPRSRTTSVPNCRWPISRAHYIHRPVSAPSLFVDRLADPPHSLSQPADCDRDIPYLQQLGVNAVRVYSVDASADHSHCMSALSQAGIYTLYVRNYHLLGTYSHLFFLSVSIFPSP